MKNGPMSEKQVAILMKKLLFAVNHLHTCGICHRDLKPENMLFVNEDANSEIKIVDFGMAAKYSTDHLNSTVGTPFFLAPEVING